MLIGYFCVYQDQESFEYIRGCAEKTLLSSLEQEDKLPFQVHIFVLSVKI